MNSIETTLGAIKTEAVESSISGALRDRRAHFETPTLAEMQEINAARCKRWHEGSTRDWSIAEWLCEMCGEAGEAANVAKKMLRIETTTPGNESSEHRETEYESLRYKLSTELADVVITAMLSASAAGVDLESAVIARFNAKSEAMGFPERL